MKEVNLVLDPDGTGKIPATQKALFELIAVRFTDFGMESRNPFSSVIDHIGNHWRNWLLLILYTGAFRPSKISRLLKAFDPSRPISHRMLTLDLRLLERDGLVQRRVVSSKINHVEYSLTELGRRLLDHLIIVFDFINENTNLIVEARARFDEEGDTL